MDEPEESAMIFRRRHTEMPRTNPFAKEGYYKIIPTEYHEPTSGEVTALFTSKEGRQRLDEAIDRARRELPGRPEPSSAEGDEILERAQQIRSEREQRPSEANSDQVSIVRRRRVLNPLGWLAKQIAAGS
jgi:hypothetical protein